MIEIPPNMYKYENRPVFVKYPHGSEDAKWYVWGPSDLVHEGAVAEVYAFKEDTYKPVHVLECIGRRIVKKRTGDPVEFVLAIFDRVVEEVI